MRMALLEADGASASDHRTDSEASEVITAMMQQSATHLRALTMRQVAAMTVAARSLLSCLASLRP